MARRRFERDHYGMSQELWSDLLNTRDCAEIAGVSHSTWYKLVKNCTAPKPAVKLTKSPGERPFLRWHRGEVVRFAELMRNAPTIAEVEAAGEFVSIKNSGVGCRETIRRWVKDEKLDLVEDFEHKLCKVERSSSSMLRTVVFLKRIRVESLIAGEVARRSASHKAYWSDKLTRQEGDETLVSQKSAMTILGVSKRQLLRWSDPHGSGCKYLGKPLTTTLRNKNGDPVPPASHATAGEGSIKYWFFSELDQVKSARNARSVTVESDANYTKEKTSELTGLSIHRLKNNDYTNAIGLQRVRSECRQTCNRRPGKAGKEKWTRLLHKSGFTKASVHRYMETHSSPRSHVGSPDSMTVDQAAEKLGLRNQTVSDWCKDGLLENSGVERYWSPTVRAVRRGYRPTRKSVNEAKKVIASAGGDLQKAKVILAERRDKARTPHGQDAGMHETLKYVQTVVTNMNGVVIESHRGIGSLDEKINGTRADVAKVDIKLVAAIEKIDAKKEADAATEGPSSPGVLIYKGKSYSFPTLRWLLIKQLWGHGAVEMTSVAEAIYPGDDECDGGLKKLLKDTRDHICTHKLPLSIKNNGGYLELKEIP